MFLDIADQLNEIDGIEMEEEIDHEDEAAKKKNKKISAKKEPYLSFEIEN